ncbi:MAG: NHL repeat-containing protein [Coriobacteriia bacterium]|nr:NHL repeat-containing protein [Coriobacteriia bacterium]
MTDTPTHDTHDDQTPSGGGVGRAQNPRSRRHRRSRTLLIVIIVILLLSLCAIGAVLARLVMPSSADVAERDEAGGIEWVRSIYGFGQSASEMFVRPAKVNVGEDGGIYVTDQQHRFVMKFSPEGQLTQVIGEDAMPPLYAVGPVAEGDGQLFFGQTAQDLVRVFSIEGEDVSNFPFPSPNDIEYDAVNDRLAVATNLGFVVFGSDGQPLYEIGGARGEGPDEFDVVPGLAYGPDGTLYVLDAYNNRMSAYDSEGNRAWQVQTGKPAKGLDITSPAMAASDDTTGTARLQVPADVVVDGNGRLVVVDSMDFSVTVFNADDGSLVAKYGNNGNKDGQFMYPTSIDYDRERDWFAIADSGNRRVQIVRIPDSSSGGGAVIGAARRVLAGPLRACLFPLILLIVMVLAWLLLRKRKGRERDDLDAVLGAPSAQPDTV